MIENHDSTPQQLVLGEVSADKARICREILEDLPEWFGIPESLEAYVREAGHLRMFGCTIDGATVGFLSVRIHHEVTAEASVLGVKRAWHRRGIGRRLFGYAEDALREDGLRVLTVKTVGAENPSVEYAATRRFYESIGFLPLETFPLLWGRGNPCLFMAKWLAPPGQSSRR